MRDGTQIPYEARLCLSELLLCSLRSLIPSVRSQKSTMLTRLRASRGAHLSSFEWSKGNVSGVVHKTCALGGYPCKRRLGLRPSTT